ncbi:GNAT family N-acetyltransferase [Pseudovibrio sp. Tun.PSC04-5.I4]|uniref:GNAT family N-acetyltransferase n=1 Tax=Pseudovibrio sp. Tun.PSC04-5.I4 TaxID=1798213 RepID=UPI0008884185|nr:GNAT family N-acetyltransferase [Pseudovibrio sp. Tun.PSC04-5.I4]SDR22818.1 Protein N-acetyltransferase, RimJ/RimL family [Pseudovibrio sp. Tun.PSC04-5.I4]
MFPNLKTKRLVLREVEQSDLNSLCKHINNYTIAKMLAHVPFPYTQMDGQRWINYCLESPLSTQTAWVIETEGDFIGVISALKLSNNEPFLGYWIAETYWNRGFASEAAAEVIRYCFETLRLERLHSSALSENIGSLKVLRKNGFIDWGHGVAHPLARSREELEKTELILTREQWEATPMLLT